MITKVRFQNFKALRDVEIDLERFTVFVGANSSGKSSILQGISYLSDLREKDWVERFGKDIVKLSSNKEIRPIELNVECNKEAFHYKVHPKGEGWTSQTMLYPNKEASECRKLDKTEIPGIVFEAVLLRLNPSVLRSPSPQKRNPTIRSNGEGLSTALAHLKLNRPDDFDLIQDMMNKIIPAFRRVRFEPVTVSETEDKPHGTGNSNVFERITREGWGFNLLFDFVGNTSGISPDMVSEGTLHTLGLLTALTISKEVSVFLLDDIENGLHPQAQRILVQNLKKLIEIKPSIQILATTHSPYLLDEVDPREIRVTVLDDTGAVVCGRIEDHPKFPRWKEAMTPGEFWSFIGEKWLLENPQLNGEKKDLAEVHGS